MNVTRVSASQVKNFQSCARLWFFQSVLKRRPPQTEAQSRGVAIHSVLEASLKGDVAVLKPSVFVTPTELLEYLEALKPFVDKGGKTGLVEHRDIMPTYDGGPDFVLVVDHAREIEVEGFGTVPQIDDLKTLSDFRYCKTPDELAKDAQMVSYGKWALWRLFEEEKKPTPNFVSLRHVYVRTRGKKIATERSKLMSPDEIQTQWNVILDDVRAMVALASSTEDAMAVMPNTSHCSAYGGCFFRPDCHGTPAKNLEEAFTGVKVEARTEVKKETNMNGTNGATPSLMSRLRARQGAAPPAPAVAAPVAKATTSATPAPAEGAFAAAGAFAATPIQQAIAAVASAKPPTATVSRLRRPAPAAPAGAPIANVLPPDAPPRETPAEDLVQDPMPSGASVSKKPGRPRKLRVEMPADAPPAVAGIGTSTAKTQEAIAAAEAAPLVASTTKFEELFVDCLPTKGGGDHGLGEDVLAMAGAEAAAKENVADWRLIPYTSRGVLANAVRNRVGNLPRTLVVTSSIPGSDVLIEVLTPIARRVVRALRG